MLAVINDACGTGVFIRLRNPFRASSLALLIAWSTAACSTPPSAAAPGRNLLPVSVPELTRVDAGVQEQVRQRHATLTSRIAGSTSTEADLATAYGELGMVLQAAEYFDAAEPCYRNAQTVAPTELRWPYYLGHLYKSKGDTTLPPAPSSARCS